MRYRLDFDCGLLTVRNVETDLEVATLPCSLEPDTATAGNDALECWVDDFNGKTVAKVTSKQEPNPIRVALASAANFDGVDGYPALQCHSGEPADPYRVEFLLGALLADATTVLARAVGEHQNDGLKGNTSLEFGTLIAQIHQIWYVSRFGSFDAERCVHEPYFADNYKPMRPRMEFAAAAEYFGMDELRLRFPDASDATLRELLSSVIALLRQTLDMLVPPLTGARSQGKRKAKH